MVTTDIEKDTAIYFKNLHRACGRRGRRKSGLLSGQDATYQIQWSHKLSRWRKLSR